IQQQDIGRSIRHFSHNLERPGLLNEIERALSDGVVIEDEARDGQGTTFFLRVLPYRAAPADGAELLPLSAQTGRIEGVVLSLTDISALDRVRSRLRQLSAIVECSEDAIIGQSLDGAITSWNTGAERLYGYSAEEAIGRHITILAPAGYEDQVATFL